MKQHEILGQWLRERYINFDYKLLSENYQKEEVLIFSSPSQRTIFSTAIMIKGLYPKSTIKPIFKTNDSIKMKNDDTPPIVNFKLQEEIPEIPFIVADPAYDVIFHAGKCKLNQNSNNTINDLLIKVKIYNYSEIEVRNAVDDIRSKWKEPFINKKDDEIYDFKFLKKLNAFIRFTEYHYNNKYFNLKESTNDVLKKVQMEKWYSNLLLNSQGLKLKASSMMNKMLEYMNIFSNRSNDNKANQLKYVLYSGHDENIIVFTSLLIKTDILRNMMNDVNLYNDFLLPQFASCFILEMHHDDETGKRFIRIIYNGLSIRSGFKDEIVYNHKLDGIEYQIFSKFIQNIIDPEYKNLKCSISEDDD